MKVVELEEADFKDNLVPPSNVTQSIFVIPGFKTERRLATKLGRSASTLVGEVFKSLPKSDLAHCTPAEFGCVGEI